jgi:hypothetical protein
MSYGLKSAYEQGRYVPGPARKLWAPYPVCFQYELYIVV